MAITVGMPLAEAMDRLARCRGAQACVRATIDPDDPVADRESLVALARWCRRFTPLVSVETVPDGEPECIQLDVGATAGLFGGEERLARLAVWTLASRGFHARVAIADTPAASWAAAHHTGLLLAHAGFSNAHAGLPTAHAGQSLVVGSGAMPAAVPGVAVVGHRFVIVPAGAAATMLAALPPRALRLDGTDLQRLAELGIDTLGAVLRLPRREIVSRFGESLPRRLAQFGGTLAEPLESPGNDDLPQARHDWEAPVLVRDMPWDRLERIVQRLVGGCVAPLAAAGRGVVALQVRLERPRWKGGWQDDRRGDHRGTGAAEGPTVIDIGLYRPSVAVDHLTDLVRLRMARAPLPPEIDAITVEVLAAGWATTRQRRLFDGGADASQARVGMLLDRLSGRLGRRAVFAPRMVADAQPEHAWMAAPPLMPAASGGGVGRSGRVAESGGARGGRAVRPAPPPTPAGAPQRRPVWLLPRPRRLEAVSVAPDGPPVRARWRAVWLRIAHAQGPERIETAWWRGPCVRRDYWIVEMESGERAWIFRRLPDGAWFMHGLFA
ncbi:MAG: Y-family DNA polymerase [Planctomycetaceae bacterium]